MDSAIQVQDIQNVQEVSEPFMLFTYTDLFGEVPVPVKAFMELHHHYCIGIIGSGNTNWGQNFCGGAIKLSDYYQIPLFRKLDVRGTPADYEALIQTYKERFL